MVILLPLFAVIAVLLVGALFLQYWWLAIVAVVAGSLLWKYLLYQEIRDWRARRRAQRASGGPKPGR